MPNRTQQLGAHAMIRVVASAEGTVIANFAWQHLKAAVTFRDQLAQVEAANLGNEFGSFFVDIRSYGSGCILSLASCLEAHINELFISPQGPLRGLLPDFERQFWGKGGIEWQRILAKYQKALQLLGESRMDENGSAYRDVWGVIELRNALVHYKPTWDPARRSKIELMEFLEGKFPSSPFPDFGADFVTMKCMGSGCLDWAINAVFTFLRDFHSRGCLKDIKMGNFWKLDT